MKTIYVKFLDPKEIMDPPFHFDEEIKKTCFSAYKYKTTFEALEAYANTRCTWSTLLEDSSNPEEDLSKVKEFIDTAWEHIKNYDYDWLEQNFT